MYGSVYGPATSGRTAHAGSATTQKSRRSKEEKQNDGEEEGGHQTDLWTNERAKVAKWAVSKAAAARVAGKTPKLEPMSDDVIDNVDLDVDERTRRTLDESDDE